MSQAFSFKALDADRAEIRIDGEIGGGWFDEDPVTAKQFAKNLKALGKPKELAIHINSPGGSVFDGSAIYSQLKRHKARKTVFVEGLAASIASMIAMAGDEVVIPANAFLMIHRASGLAQGDADEMRKTADVLEKLESGIVAAYVEKTGRDADEINELMADETWMTGAEAVAFGFADRTTDAIQATACLTPSALACFKTPPAALMTPPLSISEEDCTMSDEIEAAPLESEPAPPVVEVSDSAPPVLDASSVAAACAATASACATAGFPQLAADLIARQASADVVAARLRMATQIKAACTLAKLPERLDGYLNSGMSDIEVRADLFEHLAARDQEATLKTTPPAKTDWLEEAAAAYRSANPAASLAAAYAAVMRENPKLYDAWLASKGA